MRPFKSGFFVVENLTERIKFLNPGIVVTLGTGSMANRASIIIVKIQIYA